MGCWIPPLLSLPLACLCLGLAGAAGFFLGTCLPYAPQDFFSLGEFGNWSAVKGMALDSTNEFLYLGEMQVSREFIGLMSEESRSFPGRILRVPLSGAEATEFGVQGLERPYGLALDTAIGHIYWTDTSAGKVQRASLDGSGVVDIVTGLGRPTHIAVIPGAAAADDGSAAARDAMVFWVDVGLAGDTVRDAIATRVLDGTSPLETRVQMARVPSGDLGSWPPVQDVVVFPHGEDWTTGQRRDVVGGLAADASSEDEADWRLYWTCPGNGTIQSASPGVLDGRFLDSLTGLDTPETLVVSSDGKIMYWIGSNGMIIQYASIDGLMVTLGGDLFVTPVFPQGLALDEETDLLYWTDFVLESGKAVRRSDRQGECLIYQQLGGIFPVQGVLWANVILGVLLGCAFPCFCCFAACVVKRKKTAVDDDAPLAADSGARAAGTPIKSDDIAVIVQDPVNRTGTMELRAAVKTAARDAEDEFSKRSNVGATRMGNSALEPLEGPDIELVRAEKTKCCLFCSSG